MRLRVAVFSVLATFLFFHEYLPPLKRVHFISDIEGYHYPLLNYAYKAVREGRLPEWDPSIYSGLGFAGNIQAGLFYPPNWVLFAANSGRTGLRFLSIEALAIAHFWLAFYLAWLWLRGHSGHHLPPLLGAAVFAFSGYAVSEVQHLGVICAFAWFPLGLWGIDEARGQNRLRPLWKLVAASTMCLLAGYPPTWAAMLTAAAVYALVVGGARGLAWCAGALLVSALLSMVQIAPAMESSALKMKEQVYGFGLEGGAFFYLQFFLPNYYNQSRLAGVFGPPAEQYLYLGAPAIVALLWLIGSRRFKLLIAPAALAGAAMMVIKDPGNLVERIANSAPLLLEVLREWNFLPIIPLAAALLTCNGIGDLLERIRPWNAQWTLWAAAALAAAWSLRQLLLWRAEGAGFATDWNTAWEAAVTVLLLIVLFKAPRHLLSFALVLLTAWMEWKVYGTSRRFNSAPGNVDREFAHDMRTGGPDMGGVDPAVYREMRRNPEFRVAIDQGPHGTDMRHYKLSTPQGADPFLPAQYRQAVEAITPFESNRLFRIEFSHTAVLDAFGVRYYIATSQTEVARRLSQHERFRLMEPAKSYFQVFEYLDARPSFRFEAGTANKTSWLPERRAFRVSSKEGGEFHLLEQFYPGWEAYIDGSRVPIERVRGTFQGIRVPPGDHRVDFVYRSKGLRWGALVSITTLGLLLWRLRASRSWREKIRSPEP